MNMASVRTISQQAALETVAKFVRPLLGETGERLVQAFSTRQKRDAIMRGFVGLSFLKTDGCCILFAQTINQMERREQHGQTQNVSPVYEYSRAIPFVKAIAEPISETSGLSKLCYSLSGADFRYRAIRDPLKEAFGNDSRSGVSFALLRLVVSEEVVLYCALPKSLLNDTRIHQTLRLGLRSARSFFLLNLLNAFFLAEATLPDNCDLENLLRLLKRKLGLPPGFFDRFLRAQDAALDDLHAPSTWHTAPYNSITLPEPALHPPTAEAWLKGIRGASSITVVRPLFGSLQGKPVYLVTLVPRTHEGFSVGAAYPAVVKRASLASVANEQRGYLKVQQYFDEIRDMLPPLSVAWKLAERRCPENYVVVTPRVSGDTLRAFIRDRWESPWTLSGQRVVTLRGLFERLLRFTDVIGSAWEWTEMGKPVQQPMLDSHLGGSEEAKRRQEKTREALAFFLDSYHDTSALQFGMTIVVNPLWVFDRRRALRWITNRPGIIRASCCHGDFHAGNILVTEQGGVTVLDFDYVGNGYRFEDEATLEVSFLLSVANADKFKRREIWQDVFPALLNSLSKQTDNVTPEVSVLKNSDGYDIWTLVQTIRRGVVQRRYFQEYRALLVTALLRLTTSFRREEVNPNLHHPGVFSTAIMYLGLLLGDFVKIDCMKPCAIDLFSDELATKRKMSIKWAYPQALFKWLAGLANLKSNCGYTPFTAIEDVHLKELEAVSQRSLSDEEQASVYRFGLRLRRIAKANCSDVLLTEGNVWVQKLAELYSRRASTLSGQASRRLASWVTRYQHSDAENPRPERKQIDDRWVYQGLSVGPVERTVGGWSICGLSDCGKADEPRKNDDAFAILEVHGKLLAAVADGSGDSLDGKRASKLALSAMRENLGQITDIRKAVFMASERLQMDNCFERLDGACCLAVVHAKANGDIEAANVGDTRFVPGDEGQAPLPAKLDKASRRVLGGEPLGDIITSGGNLVRELHSREQVPLKYYNGVKRFALVTDGAFVSSTNADITKIRDILRSSTSAKEAAQAILSRALDAFENGKRPDNVTVVVGWRRIS